MQEALGVGGWTRAEGWHVHAPDSNALVLCSGWKLTGEGEEYCKNGSPEVQVGISSWK